MIKTTLKKAAAARRPASAPHPLPNWTQNVRRLMEEQGFNPRSLSLRAGLNATAVRDMLDGRTNFPRYDTAQALASALGTTPALLMGDAKTADEAAAKGKDFGQDLDLLTEIITRLQETAAEEGHTLSPRQFAAITATIYRRMQDDPARKNRAAAIKPEIHDLFDYENLRQKRNQR
jgi:transcriptional regulator with XRE-family HTH domain